MSPRTTAHRFAVVSVLALLPAARLPLLIAAGLEGGRGQQVPGATEFPPNMAFAGDPHQSLDEHQPAEYRR